ncbi:flagellum-associated coiled-coil domain-containing protein 1 [Pelodiscus sinensis]|uniref:flagellum-associated coiled-coil domain-containing protein 1 n=1 Tax=Pelodiscus sinensis TaxID=13735 RepID=UPI000D7219EF|nr:amyotrophic lateral sclerosis 2 chromosomal region candidate gene 12 protein [Pelodiscus sinensis]XP_025045695.1 amyotrophic lateral sclerosis 2 chromosomal region candidate gene 12 protein [Pelodiscus sinensis]|eukprot:XP_014434342.2 amyotrophic lateral sclerosis 2 chromosomal region candidate gene 12 protein [Pelodiscus sinensis]
MSNSHFVYCACWDPWNVRGRRLIKTRPGLLNQRARSSSLGMILKNQNSFLFALKPPSTSKGILPTRKCGYQLRSREPPDASGEFIEISPGYTLTRSKEHLSVTLGEEFFERKVTTDKPAPPFVPRSPVKLETEDVITDLEEQIAELSDMMEQLRRDHQASRKLLEKDMEEKCNEMRQEHGNKIRELQEAHRAELQALQEFYKKELKTERATAQEKMEGMQKEYKYLKNAFRMYQDSVSDEMEEKWLRRQVDWKKSERTEREKALLQQKQELMKKFELEKEQLRKSLRSGDTMMNKDIEDYIKQHQADEKKIQELQSIKESLTVEVKEKDQILTALTATMQNAQVELKKEKSNLLAMEKSIQEKISAVELKHQLNISSLTDENVVLRRKLITKNEEAYNERVQKKESNVKTALTGM